MAISGGIVYIFGIEQRNRMNEFSFYKIYLSLQGFLLVMITCEELAAKGYITEHFNWPTATFTMTLILVLFTPFDIFGREFRFELLNATWQTLISPFGEVRFKDFFLGDIFTSMPKPLVDAAFLTCFMTRMPPDDG